MDRVYPVDDPGGYSAWAAAHPWCMACWVPAHRAMDPGLSTHHVVKFRRSDDLCNLLRLCPRDHALCEGLTLRDVSGEALPKITLGIALTLKRLATPEEWNPERLRALFGRALPAEQPIPAFLVRDRGRWGRPRPVPTWLSGGTPLTEVM